LLTFDPLFSLSSTTGEQFSLLVSLFGPFSPPPSFSIAAFFQLMRYNLSDALPGGPALQNLFSTALFAARVFFAVRKGLVA